VHLATLEGRSAPQPNDPLLLGFFERLRKLNYNGMMSLECSGLEPADYRQALNNLRTYING
jgi:sugar phosphate isomerase/epimerase